MGPHGLCSLMITNLTVLNTITSKRFPFLLNSVGPGDMDNAEYNSSSVSEVDIVDLDVDDD